MHTPLSLSLHTCTHMHTPLRHFRELCPGGHCTHLYVILENFALEVIECFVRFLYHGTLDDSPPPELLWELALMGRSYDVPNLQDQCFAWLEYTIAFLDQVCNCHIAHRMKKARNGALVAAGGPRDCPSSSSGPSTSVESGRILGRLERTGSESDVDKLRRLAAADVDDLTSLAAPTEIDSVTPPMSVHSSPPPEEIDVPSPAPMEIDKTDDDESDSDLPTSVVPYKNWTNMKERVRACLRADFREYHEMVFNLAPPGQDWQFHLDHVVNEGLSVRGVTHFKFGITYTPHKRFWDDDYQGLRLMVVSLTTENSDHTADAETQAIARYKGFDKRCKNKAPGGKTAHHGVSPHFLYVVFGTDAQFRKRRQLSLFKSEGKRHGSRIA